MNGILVKLDNNFACRKSNNFKLFDFGQNAHELIIH